MFVDEEVPQTIGRAPTCEDSAQPSFLVICKEDEKKVGHIARLRKCD